ncbi:MAG: ABC transporter ATP-binding protein [Firmicutes bacterium]|nr:ABC transporter ATP-binding protein [Bacillota bacterium]
MSNDSLVVCNNLTKRYGDFLALSNVCLNLPAGKIIGLLGPNGSGKTTLIKLFVNLLMQYDGSILINGNKPGVATKKIISYLPDRNFLSDKWSAKDAMAYFKDFYDDYNDEKANRLMNELHIDLSKRFKALSKGTKEKVQLALVLSRDAKLYLFDEPIAGVDPAARDYIFKMILDNYNKDASVILSTHLISEAEEILDHIVFIKEGRVVLSDDKQKIIEEKGKSINDLFREVFRYA